jgi:peroxiredoxin
LSSGRFDLPKDLPRPVDDGAARHLQGMALPAVVLPATDGASVDLSRIPGRVVIYVYPMTGRPGRALPEGWDGIPGARGCTPQSCGFRDHASELAELGAARIAGVSTQTLDSQLEFAERNHMPFPVIADPELRLRDALQLPTFEIEGHTLYTRLALVAVGGWIAKVFYPVFPPDRSAQDVVDWLRATEAE